jgi:hypothetical protein
MINRILPVLLALGLAAAANPAYAGYIDRIDYIFRAVAACWHPPVGIENIDVTVLFSIRTDGTLIGEPHVTHASVIKDEQARSDVTASAIAAVRMCTPVHISQRLGSTIAGRMLALHLNNVRKLGI